MSERDEEFEQIASGFRQSQAVAAIEEMSGVADQLLKQLRERPDYVREDLTETEVVGAVTMEIYERSTLIGASILAAVALSRLSGVEAVKGAPGGE